jgi:hypothetical protein
MLNCFSECPLKEIFSARDIRLLNWWTTTFMGQLMNDHLAAWSGTGPTRKSEKREAGALGSARPSSHAALHVSVVDQSAFASSRGKQF